MRIVCETGFTLVSAVCVEFSIVRWTGCVPSLLKRINLYAVTLLFVAIEVVSPSFVRSNHIPSRMTLYHGDIHDVVS